MEETGKACMYRHESVELASNVLHESISFALLQPFLRHLAAERGLGLHT